MATGPAMPASMPAPASLAPGLTQQEAARRLAALGPNEPAPRQRFAGIWQVGQQLSSPLVVILVLASLVSAFLGEPVNALIILVIVGLSLTLSLVQTWRSGRAAARLSAIITLTATVQRDGVWREIPRREVVPGDVIRLAAGDLVPADARLLAAQDLHVQQAALTGESLPVEKRAVPSAPVDSGNPAARPDLVLLGTSVISGSAIAVVTATGPRTAFGDIAARLAARPPVTAFEHGTRQFGLFIGRTVLFLVLFVLLVNLAAHRPPLDSLLFAVALAVGLTPEFLPMIVTVTLTQGAVHMARRQVIVKHLEAIQNFGALDVLCSDKTGTLTSGVMTLDQALDAHGHPDVRALEYARLNSACETGISSPLDAAILAGGQVDPARYPKHGEIPFDFERRCLSVIIETAGQRLLITKGAPESVLARCATLLAGDTPQPLPPDDEPTSPAAIYRALSAQGYRVLAVAYRLVAPQPAYTVADEQDLTLVGFVTFFDEPRPDAAAALAALQRDGVRVTILTGDNELVARHVCAQVGLPDARLVLGTDLDRISDAALGAVAEATTVFARVSPAQKNRIIVALQQRGHVVGFLGDGINDAPSLYAADVGISVADGVDIAKDAADLILLERGLRVLHEGILEGRKAFGNVMKYLLMGTSSNFGNMVSMAGATLLLPFLPLLPTQILLNNFLYDLAQVTIPTDAVDEQWIQQPRRWDIALIRRFMLGIGPLSSLYDFLTFFVLLRLFHASEPAFHTGWFVESLATQTLVIFVIRTLGRPWRSRPSRPLTLTTLLIVAVGIGLPFTPLGATLGFLPLPVAYFVFLALATGTYLLLVELFKARVLGHLLAAPGQ
ncbi:MAG: magnesium-translocating P-type ATPase [Thermomicrobiales bacterium]